MNRKAFCIVVSLAILLCSCQSTQPVETTLSTQATTGGLPHNDSGYHTGESVSDAFVDPDDYTVPEEQIKATGFDYNPDELTYELVWSDEFEYDGLPDSQKWSYDTGSSGWGNHELQNYTAGENAIVSDGVLTIQLRKEEDGSYTSTRLVSREKGDWLYCKIEVRAKLPSGLGTWPAIWMLPTDYVYGEWPASGEIDIMEHVGYDQDVIVQSVHCGKYYGGNSKSDSLRVNGVSEEYHVYSVEWLPDKLIFYVDGTQTWIYDPSALTSAPTVDYWPFDDRMHLLINLAFGGDWGGAQGTDDSYFPVEYAIDYVRVYQSPEISALAEQN